MTQPPRRRRSGLGRRGGAPCLGRCGANRSVAGVRGEVEMVLPTGKWGLVLVSSVPKEKVSYAIICFSRGARSRIACLMAYLHEQPCNERKMAFGADCRACRAGGDHSLNRRRRSSPLTSPPCRRKGEEEKAWRLRNWGLNRAVNARD